MPIASHHVRRLHEAPHSPLHAMLLLAAQSRVESEQPTTEALALMLMTMLLATNPTNNAILAQEKLHRTPCSRTHLGDAPLARLWPFLAHPTDRDRCNIDGTKLRWPWSIRRARFGGRIAQLRGASWPTNNGRRSLSDRRGTRNTVPLGSWSQAKLLSQWSCSPGDRGDRWRRNAKSAFISQTRSRAQTFLTWVYGGRA